MGGLPGASASVGKGQEKVQARNFLPYSDFLGILRLFREPLVKHRTVPGGILAVATCRCPTRIDLPTTSVGCSTAVARQVAELIAGLKDLGCERATGEDQTICVMSDSFDVHGSASDLKDSGDLPDVEIVKVKYEASAKT